jgi:hypothetical protein
MLDKSGDAGKDAQLAVWEQLRRTAKIAQYLLSQAGRRQDEGGDLDIFQQRPQVTARCPALELTRHMRGRRGHLRRVPPRISRADEFGIQAAPNGLFNPNVNPLSLN